MIIRNSTLCQNANNISLKLYHFGYASVNTQWKGHVQTPTVSRLYYIISGNAYISFSSEKFALNPGNWYILPAGFSFSFNCSHKMEHLFFHITLSGPDGIDLLGNLKSPVFLPDHSNPDHYFKQCLQENNLLTAITVKGKIYSKVLKLIENKSVLPDTIVNSPCVKKAVEFINKNLNRKLTLTNIAESAYVSNCTLTRKFKKELKITVQEYIQAQRMFKAVQLLKHTQMSIAQISENLGFSEQFYFSRCFKNHFGISPSEYRKSTID